MIITCNSCRAKLKLDDNLINSDGLRVRCSKCHSIFTIYPDETKPAMAPAEGPEPSGPAESDQAAKGRFDFEKVICIGSQKGGVGKTTTCLNLGTALTLFKKKVLLIDFDVQASLTVSLGYKNTPSFYDIATQNSEGLSGVIKKTKYANLWMLPSNKNMVLLNKNYFGAEGFEYLLRDKLRSVMDQFDYILIDTPPGTEFFTINALAASKRVIVPSECGYLSTHGVNQTVKLIELMKHNVNPHLDYKVLITMFDPAGAVSKLIQSKLEKMHNGKLFNTVIHHDEKIKESQIMNAPAIYYYKHGRAGLQYVALAKEIMGETRTE